MAYFPIFIDLESKNILVIGGGIVALRKVEVLLKFTSKISIISKNFCNELTELVAINNDFIKVMTRPFSDEDMKLIQGHKYDIVIVATNDHELNRTIADSCKTHNVLVNVVDVPELCSFYFPAIIKRDEFVVGLNSSGKAPGFTSKVRKLLDANMPQDLGEKVQVMYELRKALLLNNQKPSDNEDYKKLIAQTISQLNIDLKE